MEVRDGFVKVKELTVNFEMRSSKSRAELIPNFDRASGDGRSEAVMYRASE